MRTLGRLSLALLAFLSGCVSVNGPALSKGEIAPGQRTIVLVFAAPTPLMRSDNSNVATAAEIIPGLGMAVQSVKDDHSVELSQDLAQALPGWHPGQEFAAQLMTALQGSGYPGRWVAAADSEIIPARLSGWNEADNVADWRTRYYGIGPIPPTTPRNYAEVPGISDSLILESNLAWGLKADADGNETPFLSCQARLYSAAGNKLLWSQEENLPDAGFKGSFETLKPNGQLLESHWRSLMAPLAAALSNDFRKDLAQAGLYTGPAFSPAAPAAPASSAYQMSAPGASAYQLTLPAAPAAAPATAPASNPNGLESHP